MNRNLSSAYDIICGRRILGTIQDQPWLLIYIPAALRPEGRLESWERSYRFTDDEGPKSSPEHPWNIIHQCILKLEQKTNHTFDINPRKHYEFTATCRLSQHPYLHEALPSRQNFPCYLREHSFPHAV